MHNIGPFGVDAYAVVARVYILSWCPTLYQRIMLDNIQTDRCQPKAGKVILLRVKALIFLMIIRGKVADIFL
jgi:hypothetical protein